MCLLPKYDSKETKKHIVLLAFIPQMLPSHFLIYLSVSFPPSSTFLPTGCKHARPKHHLLCFSDGSVETMYCHDLLHCATTFFTALKYALLMCAIKFLYCVSLSLGKTTSVCDCFMFCCLKPERSTYLEETGARVCGRISGRRCEGSQRTSCNVTKASRRT